MRIYFCSVPTGEEQHIFNILEVIVLEGNTGIRSSPTNSSSDENDVEHVDDPTCSICIEKITKSQTLAYNSTCAHKMHRKCCVELLTNNSSHNSSTAMYRYHFIRAGKCPECRNYCKWIYKSRNKPLPIVDRQGNDVIGFYKYNDTFAKKVIDQGTIRLEEEWNVLCNLYQGYLFLYGKSG